MALKRSVALLYAVLSLAIVAFQIALAAGAPWGAFARSSSLGRISSTPVGRAYHADSFGSSSFLQPIISPSASMTLRG
jgi:hypothetical protein